MPNFLENTLQAAAAKKGLKGRAAARYTYGALNNIGAYRGNRETTKGRSMQRKHDTGMRGQLIGLDSMRKAA